MVRANLRLLDQGGSASPEDDGRIVCGSNLEVKKFQIKGLTRL